MHTVHQHVVGVQCAYAFAIKKHVCLFVRVAVFEDFFLASEDVTSLPGRLLLFLSRHILSATVTFAT